MRPADLKFPFFSKADKKIIIQDRVWYLPEVCKPEKFQFPGWDAPQVFGNQQPINVEYCSGNGDWIAAKAIAFPHINWVAVEKKFMRARKIWSKIKNHKLNNLFVICGEAHRVTTHYFPVGALSNVFVNFPDPWPKNRHAKHRLIQTNFVCAVSRVLKREGILTLVTDDHIYSSLMIDAMLSVPAFQPLDPEPYYVTDQTGYGTSYFEQIWREKGLEIRYHRFKKGLIHIIGH